MIFLITHHAHYKYVKIMIHDFLIFLLKLIFMIVISFYFLNKTFHKKK
jgi:hypothetical protein